MAALSSLISLKPPGSDYTMPSTWPNTFAVKLDSVLTVRLYDRVTDLLNENQT